MKKILFALVCAFSGMVALAIDNVVTNVYDFKSSIKVPYLKNGIRTYQNQSLKGYLYAEVTDGQATAMWLEIQNSKTKVIHVVEINNGFYVLIGKSNKYSARTVPSIYYEAADIERFGDDSHEKITKIQFAGTGSLKYVKTVVSGCTMCGEPTTSTSYCNILWNMSGYCTGVMDCECPDEEPGWWHTVKTTLCGVFYDDNDEVERFHDAAIWGTWSAVFNKKLSDTVVK